MGGAEDVLIPKPTRVAGPAASAETALEAVASVRADFTLSQTRESYSAWLDAYGRRARNRRSLRHGFALAQSRRSESAGADNTDGFRERASAKAP